MQYQKDEVDVTSEAYEEQVKKIDGKTERIGFNAYVPKKLLDFLINRRNSFLKDYYKNNVKWNLIQLKLLTIKLNRK